MKLIFNTILFLISIQLSHAQVISGMVADQNHRPLPGATVLELGTQNGVITNVNGRFQLELTQENSQIQVSYAGYKADTLVPTPNQMMHIKLEESTEELSEVVVKASSTFFDRAESKHVEVITEKELLKAACCNLSESFETNASVDVSYADGVTGAKTIMMLGLDGRYVQINRENLPNIRGLIGRYGMGYIPGTWIQSIDVGKGAGSVVNGYESMTGQINVEMKKPESSEKLYLNGYVNSFGRLEYNANWSADLSDRWSAGLLLHTDMLNNDIDNNDDGFMDIPKTRQVNVLNRYKYQGEKFVSQIGINYLLDEKAGGQTGFGFKDDAASSSLYGFMNRTSRVEVFGKTGLLFPEKPYKGWGFLYSVSRANVEAAFGRDQYQGQETTVYGNLIFQNIIAKNSFHQYKTGVSFLYDSFDETYIDSTFTRQEVVPGLYFEYTYKPGDDFSLVAGLRTDFHNLFGTWFSPRLHSRYQITENTTLRGSIGKGYRVGNVLVENTGALVSNRTLIVNEAPQPEESWNMGLSVVSGLPLGGKTLDIVGDYFYTDFLNQLIYDMDQNSQQVNIYNLDGRSYAHSFQVEASYPVTDLLTLKGAYKYYDVRTTIDGQLMQMPFISRDRLFLNASFSTPYDTWGIDGTLQWYGSKRLPNTTDKPGEFQRAQASPDFFLLNMQVSKGFRWGNIYLGSENMLNFMQDDPIIDPGNPFGENFDASIVWAPIAGRMIYAGIRFKIDK